MSTLCKIQNNFTSVILVMTAILHFLKILNETYLIYNDYETGW